MPNFEQPSNPPERKHELWDSEGKDLRWDNERKESVLRALDHILEALKDYQESLVEFSDEFDDVEKRLESDKRLFSVLGFTPRTREEQEQQTNDSRNKSAVSLGHIEKRLDEIRLFKEAVEQDRATETELKKIYEVIFSSLLKVVFEEEIDSSKGRKKQNAEKRRAYAQALEDGFMIESDMIGYPYDDPTLNT